MSLSWIHHQQLATTTLVPFRRFEKRRVASLFPCERDGAYEDGKSSTTQRFVGIVLGFLSDVDVSNPVNTVGNGRAKTKACAHVQDALHRPRRSRDVSCLSVVQRSIWNVPLVPNASRTYASNEVVANQHPSTLDLSLSRGKLRP